MAKKKINRLFEPDTPVAMTESALNAIVDVQESDGFKAVMAEGGTRREDGSYTQMRGDVAVIDITGPILRRGGDFLSFFFNITSVDGLAKDFKRAVDDPAVKAIVLNIDSPGGTVPGINELSEQIHQARGTKPIISYIDFYGASAAYWIASAADKIIIDDTALVGSIGVVGYAYRKDSREIVNSASPKKRDDPDSDQGRKSIVARLDALADVFITAVARNRGVDAKTVISDFGQGDVLVGKAAVDAGLADGLGSFEGVIDELQSQINLTKGRMTMADKLSRETLEQNFEVIGAQAPDLIEKIKTASEDSGFARGKSEGIEAGMQAERDRVKEIMAIDDADPDAKAQAISDGLSVEESYKLFYEAEKKKKDEKIQDLEDDAPDSAGMKGKEKADQDGSGFMAKVDEYQNENKCSRTDAMKVIVAKYPEEHLAWLDGQ